MGKHFKTDIQAVLDRDPAARSKLEVMLCYPGYKAVRRHRRAHWFYKHGMKLLARFISERTRKKTGIDIHPGAVIGEGLFIDHGMGVVIGETTEIGNNCTLFQNVTLGGTGKETGKRHPTLGDNVMVAAGAKVLGPFKVGDNSKIGAGAVVLCEVPENCTVVGVPGRIVKRNNVRVDNSLMDQRLPDPMLDRMEALVKRLTALEACLRKHADKLDCRECFENEVESREGRCTGCTLQSCTGSDTETSSENSEGKKE